MKVVVTGGAGFIGSHLVDAYIKKGDEVLVVDDLSSGREENISPKARLAKCSLLDSQLKEIIKDFAPDLVNHHAAQKSVRDSVTNPAKDCQINILGLLHLLEALKATSCRKILFASTGGAIYGEQDYFPADEKHPLKPLSPYGISKLASEHYLRFACLNDGFSAGVLRYSNVYGPRQDPEGEAGVVAIFCSRLLQSKDLTIFGSGEQTRDFVYVDDVVSANLAAEKGLDGYHEVNIATSVESSVNQLAANLIEIAGSKSKVVYEAAKPGEQMRSLLSVERARQYLAWQPRINFAEGLKKTFEWFQTNQNQAG